MAAALLVFRANRRPLVADHRRRLLPARDEEGARHAPAHAGMATTRAAHESARARGRREREPDDTTTSAMTDMSAEGPPQGANRAPSGGSAAAQPQAWGHPDGKGVVIYTDGACKG